MNTPERTNEALIDELVICGIYTREHDTNPRKALLDVIHWHVSVALDPAVSSEARALQSTPAAWSYEQAHTKISDGYETQYGDWRHHLSVEKPDVPDEAIRNLRALAYTHVNTLEENN